MPSLRSLTRENRQEGLSRLAQASLASDPRLTLEHWLADAEIAFKAAYGRLLYEAWDLESRTLDAEQGGTDPDDEHAAWGGG